MAASYTFEDYSGSAPSISDNPYDGLIEACHGEPAEIQARYNTHRSARAKQQREKLLSPGFTGVAVDQILKRLEDPSEPDFQDPRHCLVFWARPPQNVKDMIAEVQRRLRVVASNLWLMPQSNLHMTALEITHSLTSPEILALVEQLRPAMETITDYPYHDHRPRLVKPIISYDAQALALSFLPASGEPGRGLDEDKYTYHHLRRDLFALATETGVKVASRYVVPSAHLTIARFIDSSEFETTKSGEVKVDSEKVKKLVETIEEINEWLEKEFWPSGEEGEIKAGGEWIVGQEKGLDFRQGSLWYGGGNTVRLGKGF